MKTKNKTKLEDIIKKKRWYYLNENLTTKNFPIPEVIETEGWKIINIDKAMTSKEVLAKIKAEGCRPANVYELALFDREQIPKGKWLLALGHIWGDSSGFHGVPGVRADTGGVFDFGLGHFGDVWRDDDAFFCFCDSPLVLGNSEKSLTLESAIKMVKKAGYQVIKQL